MIKDEVIKEILDHAAQSDKRYGAFTSTHEALGVALEEFNELASCVQANALEGIRAEAIDLAAVCYRLAFQIRANYDLRMRSMK